MGITEDFETLKENKEVAELAIKIRAEMEYCKRVLEEHLANWNEDIADANWASIPESIRTEGLAIKNKYQTLVDNLNANHSEFLTIT
jgi:hypothetical protein